MNGKVTGTRGSLEPLEPRFLLNGDCLGVAPPLVHDGPICRDAVCVDLDGESQNALAQRVQTGNETRTLGGDVASLTVSDSVRNGGKGVLPTLSGLELIDPDPGNLQEQVIYLDFDGAEDVLYEGPVAVGPLDILAFQAPGGLAGQEQAIIQNILERLERMFSGSGIHFTAERPSGNQPYSTIHVGEIGSAFSQYGSFLGLAEQVDVGNADRSDIALVFAEAVSLRGHGRYEERLAEVIAHETAHLLGYGHAEHSRNVDNPLAEVAASLSITAEHGSVAVSPSKSDYTPGEVVELIPMPETGYCFTGWSGDGEGKSLVLNLTMDGDKAVTANFEVWQPPIGIPVPEFGIFETHAMYEGRTYDFGSGPEPYRDAGSGPYTHYIDNTHPNATDTDNPYGTADRPRLTIPRDLLAGSVVEIHGGPYTYGSGGKVYVTGVGSAALPIFIRGDASRPQFNYEVVVIGQYLIIESISTYRADISIRIPTGYDYSGPLQYISIRDCETQGDGTAASNGGVGVGANQDHIVVYGNHLHHNGDYAYEEENDHMGVSVGYNSHYVWVVDNHIHHNGGDSFQAGHAAEQTISHIYIGRNVMHDDGENAVDLKDVTDVIVSQNTMYNYPLRNASSDGTIAVVHYGPSSPEHQGTIRAWFIGNEMYNAGRAANQVSSGPRDTYFIGNVIHDIDGAALMGWSHEDVYFIGNTMYNVGLGIDDSGSDTAVCAIVNNIFGELNSLGGTHITLDYAAYRSNAIVSNNLLQDPIQANVESVNSVEADPLFVDAASGNFYLHPMSPAIDAGTSSGVVQEVFDRFQQLYDIDIRKDIDGQTRPEGPSWDIGAYEYVLDPQADTTAPRNISGFAATVGDGQISLRWTNPTEADFAGVRILRKTASSPTSPMDGTVIYQGTGTSKIDTGLANGTTYYYRAFTYDAVPNFSSGVTVSGTPVASADTMPPGNVSGFGVVAGDSQMNLSWTNPTEADFAGVRILRKTASSPTSPTDGTVIYRGTGTSKIDTGLANGTTYYYRAFTYDEVPNYSSGTTASGTPSAVPSLGRTIYVDQSIISGGDAAGDCLGTYDPATRSGGLGTTTAYNTLMEASLAALPGDTIAIRGGVYEGAQILRPQNSGSPGLPITYRNYNGEQVIIRNTNGLSDLTADEVAADQVGRQYGIYIYDKSYIVIEGLQIINVSGWARIVNSDHITLKDCDFASALSSGTTGSVKFVHSDYNQVLNNRLHEGNDNLLLIHSDNNLVEGNDFVNGRHTLWCIRAGNFNVLRNNYFYNDLQKIGEIYDAETDLPITLDATKYNVVEGNIFAKTASSGNASPYAGIQFAGQRCIIRNNVFYETIGPALDMTYYADEARYNYENRIYNNVFYGTDFAGVVISSSTTLRDNIFKNNILVKSVFVANDTRWSWYTDQLAGKPVQLMIGRIGGFLFEGNDLFNVQAGEDHLITHGTRFDGYLTSPHGLSWWQVNYPSIFSRNLELSPGFVDEANHNYHLTASSPMIDAGVHLTATSGAGTGTQMPVLDARYFYDGYGIDGEQGDLIKLQSGQTARIIDIDHAGNVIALDRQVSWGSDEQISLYYDGAAPDIGAFEYGASSQPDTTAPGNVSGFAATAGDGQISLSWTNPTDADFAGVRILRKTSDSPTNPTDGTVVYQGIGTSKLDAGLTNGTTYYYRAFTYDEVPNYAAGATVSATPLTVPTTAEVEISFQQNVNGYVGTVDTQLHQRTPDASYANATTLNVDNDDGTGSDVQVLLRFKDIFGSGTRQIPVDAQVVSAQLQLQVTNPGDSMEIHRMLHDWSGTDTWNSLNNGIQVDGIDATRTPDAVTGTVGTGLLTIDVTASLKAWQANPATNYGWAIVPTGGNGVDFHSAEGTAPPRLIVTWVSPVAENVAQGKTATQSSTYMGAAASRAVDGEPSGAWSGGSLSCTTQQVQPWWQVDLGGLYEIIAIEIWNRTDQCQDRLDDFYVFVSDVPFASTDPVATANQTGVWNQHVVIPGGPRPDVSLSVEAVGRYVRVQLADANYLTLAEVKVFGQVLTLGSNVAEGKTATQSSTYAGAAASRAVDGDTDGAWSGDSLSCMTGELNAWWQVDLGGLYDISAIEIWNRTDGCQDRLDDFYVFVSDVPFASTDPVATANQTGVWNQHVVIPGGPRPDVSLSVEAVGRYVRVQLADANHLTLAEVKVFGQVLTLGSNVAEGKTATQSSTYAGAAASRAVDGDTDGAWSGESLSCTTGELNAWWQVDLGALYEISAIEIWNRTDGCQDRLDDFYVFVSDTPFTSTDPVVTANQAGVWSQHVVGIPLPSMQVSAGTVGRYVRIQLADTNYLTLAEVKVFGEPLLV